MHLKDAVQKHIPDVAFHFFVAHLLEQRHIALNLTFVFSLDFAEFEIHHDGIIAINHYTVWAVGL